MSLDAPSPQDSQQLLLYKIAVATVTTSTSTNTPSADQKAALDAADAPSAENPFITASGLPAATTTTAGVVLLAECPDETTNPGSTKILTAGDFNTAGVELLDSGGGMMFANEFYANVIGGRNQGLHIHGNADGWRMRIGTGVPDDTVVDAYGVGSNNDMWRVGRHSAGVAMHFDSGCYPMQFGSSLYGAMSEGFLFTETADNSTVFFGMDSGGFSACRSSGGDFYIGPGSTSLTAETGGTLALGSSSGSYVSVGAADGRVSFFGANPVIKQTATPANATDLASAIALVNNLKAKLIAYGLIA